MKYFIKYILEFLLGEQNIHLVDKIEYADDSSAVIVICPSAFFHDDIYMTQASIPQIPLKEIEGVPLLYGNEKIVKKNDQIIVQADIIASTFFLITRYEECLDHQNRDQYKRFIGRKSLPYRAGFIMRPIVDEYGKLLRGWLRDMGFSAVEPPAAYNQIYLTHDVDEIWQWDNLYRALRTFGKRIVLRKPDVFESLKAWYKYEKYDRVYTFPWLTEVDQKMVDYFGKNKCKSVYFMKSGGDTKFDNLYYKKTFRVKRLIHFLKKNGADFGIHTSFSAGEKPMGVEEEKKNLEKVLGEQIKWNRNHYLCSREPEDMEILISAGITDDFTMGYADVAGFRLGTSRAVKWINPFTKELTSLILHPLTIMECTLDSDSYMNLNEEAAYDVICRLLNTVKQYNGDVVLLWHNTSVSISGSKYQRSLYERTLNFLAKS